MFKITPDKKLIPSSSPVKIDLRVLGTGSSGNCLILNDEIAFDCGLNKFANHFTSNLNTNKNIARLKLKTIILSHAHADHCNGLSVSLSKDFPALESIVFPLNYVSNLKTHIKDSNLKFIDKLPVHLKNSMPTNCTILHRFDVGHDISNDGYILYYQGKLLLYATDIGNAKSVYLGYNYDLSTNTYTFYNLEDLANTPQLDYTAFDLYLLECNHDKNTLLTNLAKQESKARQNYYNRSLNVHLNTFDCNLMIHYTKNKDVLLVHRSIENLPINHDTYFFITQQNQNVKIAINPWEESKYQNILTEFHLTTELKTQI